MSRLVRIRTAAILAVAVSIFMSFGVVQANAARTSFLQHCFDSKAKVDVEVSRLAQQVPQEILQRSRFNRFETPFKASLCFSPNFRVADTLVKLQGTALWKYAVAVAQGKIRNPGDLNRTDDRPLYWARLTLARAIEQWSPHFHLSDSQRQTLLGDLDKTSRGETTTRFPAHTHFKKILISGFDPFFLDTSDELVLGLRQDVTNANPAGSIALTLDGRTIDTPAGRVIIQAAIFPVDWAQFTEGDVEHMFLPHLQSGPQKVDMFMTISEGVDPGTFDLEHYNGAHRAGADNQRVSVDETIPIPSDVPTVKPQPQFTKTTLPVQIMASADTGRFNVIDHTTVTEILPGGTDPVTLPDGPVPGGTAVGGGGLNFLSNGVAYRTTLLRDAVDPSLPGGHAHTPPLNVPVGKITDSAFEQDRADIIAQATNLLKVAAGTLQ